MLDGARARVSLMRGPRTRVSKEHLAGRLQGRHDRVNVTRRPVRIYEGCSIPLLSATADATTNCVPALHSSRGATAGMDRLCVWDVESKTQDHTRWRPARSVDASDDKIAAGLDDGSVVVVDASTMETLVIISGSTKDGIEERRHHAPVPAASWPRSAGQQHEA